MPPPPPPPGLGTAEDLPALLFNAHAFNALLAADPERAAALLRLLDGATYVSQAAAHAALVEAPLLRILNEWSELLALTGEPRPKAPPRPRPPRRPSIAPALPQRRPRAPHGPDDGRRRRWPRIRVRPVRAPAWP